MYDNDLRNEGDEKTDVGNTRKLILVRIIDLLFYLY
jgi:hypothetical protein